MIYKTIVCIFLIGASLAQASSQSVTQEQKSKPKVFFVSDFGAVGDGKTDDGPAIRAAVEAAVKAAPDSTVVFDRKPYRMGKYRGSQIRLSDVSGVTLEGNDAEIVNNPYNSFLSIDKCSNIIIRGFTFDCFPLGFTQGTITQVDDDTNSFQLQLHDGYDNTVELSEKHGKKLWDKVGFLIDADERRLKRGGPDHHMIKDVTGVNKNVLRIQIDDNYFKNIEVGDRFVISHKYSGGSSNISVCESSDIYLQNYTVYTAKYGMTHLLWNNKGRVYVKNVTITFKPGTDRLVSNVKDGFHCKHNAVGPVIEDCRMEGLMDDSINISVCPYWVIKDLGNNNYLISASARTLAIGDRLMAFTPTPGIVSEDLTVLSVGPAERPDNFPKRGRLSTITLDKPIPGLSLYEDNPSGLFPGGHHKMTFTGLYNLDRCGKDYIVRNNYFGPQRRFSVLARSRGGVIEGNTIKGGAGIQLNNETGSFYEGPIPGDVTIRNNTFEDNYSVLNVHAKGNGAWADNITIEDNRIISPKCAPIYLHALDGGTIAGNTIEAAPIEWSQESSLCIVTSKNMSVEKNNITINKDQEAAINIVNSEDVKEKNNKIKMVR